MKKPLLKPSNDKMDKFVLCLELVRSLKYLFTAVVIMCLSHTQIFADTVRNSPRYPSCGLYCLVTMANDLGVPITCEEVVDVSDYFRSEKSSFLDIVKGAALFGLQLTGVRIDQTEWKDIAPPVIAAVSPEHFQVIRSTQNTGIYTIDNTGLEKFETWEKFIDSFRSAALIVGEEPYVENLPDELLFYNQTTDFGWVNSRPNIKYRFRAKNWSTESVTIRTISTTCGCTTISIEPEIVPVGEEVVITVDINKGIVQGPLTEQVVLELTRKSAASKRVELRICAEVGYPYKFVPDRIQRTVLVNNKLDPETIKLEWVDRNEAENWKINEVVTKSNGKIIQSKQNENQIELNYKTMPQIGVFKDDIFITMVNINGQKTSIKIPVEVEVHGDVISNIKSIQFGVINAKSNTQKEILLRSLSHTPFSIERVETDLPFHIDIKNHQDLSDKQSVLIDVVGSDFTPNKIHKGNIRLYALSSKGESVCSVECILLRGLN